MPKYGKFRTRILAAEERRRNAEDIKPMAKRNMGVEFTTKDGKEVAFRMKGMPPILKDLSVNQEKKLNEGLKEAIRAYNPVTRYKEDEDTGMLKRETLLPKNKMGSIALREAPMPMAYKHKVVKKTAAAKAIPFTAK